MIGLNKSECGCGLNPVQELGVVGGVCFASGRLSPHAVVHAPDPRDHRFGGTAGSVYGHHRRKPRAAKTAERVFAKTAVLPDAGPHSRLGELRITAVTPPMYVATGFLKMRQATKSGALSAGSPAGRLKSIARPPSGNSSSREALSSRLTIAL